MYKNIIKLVCVASMLVSQPLIAKPGAIVEIFEEIPVAKVWAGHPVSFSLLTHGDKQFVAFFDANRKMTVGERLLDSNEWLLQQLPTSVVWDSHNYVTMFLDDGGYLHVSGNMHGDPLIYFRSERPLDVTSLKRVPVMVGELEEVSTYPNFMRGPNDELIFNYRFGSSSAGIQINNVYDLYKRTWTRLSDAVLSDGEGLRNAYFQRPKRGPDGYFHMTWIWRDTGDAATNQDLCYGRSLDLINWETATGEPFELPIRFGLPSLVVDPVPTHAGMLNGNGKIGFDSEGRVILAYHKFDDEGNTQLYNVRLEAGEWKIYQTTDWSYRWDFGGNGTILMDITIAPVVYEDGRLTQKFSHVKEGEGVFVLDEETLKPIEILAQEKLPDSLTGTTRKNEGLIVNLREDLSGPMLDQSRYVIKWDTLPKNRDKPREKPWPAPTMLNVYRIK